MLTFQTTAPEETGIPSASILRFIERLRSRQITMHSLLLMRHDRLIFEGYYAPYRADTLHRMFSISKSFTAVAVGLLADEGKLSLEDPIINYFPEKLPGHVHPWIAAMTIRNMLMMRTCHASTTYKIDMESDWVESFFTTPPTHPAGTLFHYDTSAAHTLCALVEKLSGMDMLDYLKYKLSPLGFSEASYLLKDPFGVSMGGSGLVALPMDLLKFGYFIAHRGFVSGKQLISPDFIGEAVSLLSETCVNAPIPGEACGYGMQFWRGAKNGYTCYGMGGQLIIFLPDHDLLCITTADTQEIQGGNQQIYDALYEEILPHLRDSALPVEESAADLLRQEASRLMIEPVKASSPSQLPPEPTEKINGKTFRVQTAHLTGLSEESKSYPGFESFTLCFGEGHPADRLSPSQQEQGCLSFVYHGQTCRIPFGIGALRTGVFPIYDQRCAASGSWLSDGTFYIKVHIIDSYVGSVHFQLSFGEDDLTVFLRKHEESLFQEFSGHLYCISV